MGKTTERTFKSLSHGGFQSPQHCNAVVDDVRFIFDGWILIVVVVVLVISLLFYSILPSDCCHNCPPTDSIPPAQKRMTIKRQMKRQMTR